MNTSKTTDEAIKLAASALGKLGGKAGRGDSKRRSLDHYRKAGLRSVEVRRAKKQALSN